jgi:hypothetical protein
MYARRVVQQRMPYTISRPPWQALYLMAYISTLLIHAEIVDYRYCSNRAAFMNRLFAYPIIMTVYYLIWMASTMDPGVLDESSKVLCSKKLNINDSVAGDLDIQQHSQCHTCEIEYPIALNVHHCRTCGYCVIGFDHHCGILGRCVGAYNRVYFIFILGLGVIGHFVSLLAISCRDKGSVMDMAAELFRSVIHLNAKAAVSVSYTIVEDYGVMAMYAYMGTGLIFFFLFHLYTFTMDSSTYSCLKQRHKRFNCGGILNMLHQRIDLRNSKHLKPSMRWKILALQVPLPFACMSIYRLYTATESSIYVMMWCMCTLCVTLGCTYYMRMVILYSWTFGTSASEAGHTQHAVGSVSDTDVNAAILEEEELLPRARVVEEEDANERHTNLRPEYYFCEDCDCCWKGQDHHCGIFGVCIHKHNRQMYMKCVLLGTLGTGLYTEYAITLLRTHWEFTLSWSKGYYGVLLDLCVSVFHTSLIWIFLYASMGISLCGFFFYLQQYFYLDMVKKLSRNIHGTSNPTDNIYSNRAYKELKVSFACTVCIYVSV